MTKLEHDNHCKSIAETLKKYNSGDYFLYDGELFPLDSEDEFWSTENNSYYLDDDGFYYYEIDGEKIDERDVEPASLWDYFDGDGIYNIDYVCNSYKELQAVRIMIACGGPNIYINTWDKKVELYWWTEHGEHWLDNDLCEAINEVFEQYWNC